LGNATVDPEVMQALTKLLDELKKEGIGGKAIAQITANVSGSTVGVAGAQNVTIGSM